MIRPFESPLSTSVDKISISSFYLFSIKRGFDWHATFQYILLSASICLELQFFIFNIDFQGICFYLPKLCLRYYFPCTLFSFQLFFMLKYFLGKGTRIVTVIFTSRLYLSVRQSLTPVKVGNKVKSFFQLLSQQVR